MNKGLEMLTISSFNCRGLRDQKKRSAVFNWLQTKYNGLLLLQETHSVLEDTWTREWDGDIYFAHGTNQSRGVAIFIPTFLRAKLAVNQLFKDSSGRYIFLDCSVENNHFLVVNVYAPTKDHLQEQLEFLNSIKQILEQNNDKNIIIGGDLNTYLNMELDKKGGTRDALSKYSNTLVSVMEEFSLIDIWRIRNPQLLQFTRREGTRIGLVQSRLDYFLISSTVTAHVFNCTINPGFRSDHSIVNLKLELFDTQKRGKGYWKFNNKLLTDDVYINLIKKEIMEIKKQNFFSNKNTAWEFFKCQIRTITISYCISKAKRNKEKEKFLLQKLQKLESESHDTQEYYKAKQEWEHFENSKAEGTYFRSKVKWAEKGEKNTKYFLNLEKQHFNQKYIKKLIIQDSIEVTDPHQILEEQQKHFEKLYRSKQSQGQEDYSDFLYSNNNQKILKSIDKELCDSPLRLEEIGKALKQLQNDKTPGSDGFTTNFYKFFWPDLREFLFDSYKYSFEHGMLTCDQRRGILNLIPKGNKDIRFLSNWRPVSILNTDYKILTKALAIRLQSVLPSLIHSDQVGYLKERFIGENIRTIDDIMSYTNLKQLSGYILLIDFEKAFDSIEWSFLQKSLKFFNFGQNFIRWIEILYTKIEGCVSNNGYLSKICVLCFFVNNVSLYSFLVK